MTNIYTTTDEPHKTSDILYNVPIPSGNNNTVALDYDKNRFFAFNTQNVDRIKRRVGQNNLIKQLCENIKTILPEESVLVSGDREEFIVRLLKLLGVSPEVGSFCSQNGILQYVRPTISLIEKCFPTLKEYHLEIENDPESDEEWLTIDITVEGEVKEILKNYNSYITMFVSEIPWPEREKIILSYNIL